MFLYCRDCISAAVPAGHISATRQPITPPVASRGRGRHGRRQQAALLTALIRFDTAASAILQTKVAAGDTASAAMIYAGWFSISIGQATLRQPRYRAFISHFTPDTRMLHVRHFHIFWFLFIGWACFDFFTCIYTGQLSAELLHTADSFSASFLHRAISLIDIFTLRPRRLS